MKPQDRREALKALTALRRTKPEPGVLAMMANIENMLRTPMVTILKKVPGNSLAQKAALIGVSRQTLYAWTHNGSRPNIVQSKRLAELTGLDADFIRGRKTRQSVKYGKAAKRVQAGIRKARARTRQSTAASALPPVTSG